METSYIRDANHLYLIEGYPSRFYWTGTIAEALQLLVVVQVPSIIAIVFDRNGDLVRVERRMLSSSTIEAAERVGFREFFQEQGDRELSSWLHSLGFQEAVIKVKRFYLPDYHIGIVDFPRFFQDVLCNPSAYSEDEQRLAQTQRDRWFTEGLFELWLNEGTDLWVTATGEIESS
jgi:hypothetical protein